MMELLISLGIIILGLLLTFFAARINSYNDDCDFLDTSNIFKSILRIFGVIISVIFAISGPVCILGGLIRAIKYIIM